MHTYFLNMNEQPNGDHEIHKSSCFYYNFYKEGNNYVYLGIFLSDSAALAYTMNKYPYLLVDGCIHCCPIIHER